MLKVRTIMQSILSSMTGAMVLYVLLQVGCDKPSSGGVLSGLTDMAFVTDEEPQPEPLITHAIASGASAASGNPDASPFLKPSRLSLRETTYALLSITPPPGAISFCQTFSSFRILPNAP